MTEEIWKFIDEDKQRFYQISNKGNVRGVDRYINKRHGKAFIKGKLLSKGIDKNGYVCISLNINGKYKTMRVHRLVANAFIPKEEGKDVVNHIDGDKTNNNIENLEWCTQSENVIHAIKNGLMTHLKQNSDKQKKVVVLTDSAEDVFVFESLGEAGEILGVSQSYLSQIINGDRPELKGYKLQYAKQVSQNWQFAVPVEEE